MKVRIDIGPLATYTGKLGGVHFMDGVSVREVTPKEARRIGINVRIVNAETGEQAGTKFSADVGAIPAVPLVAADATPEVEAAKPAPVAIPVEADSALKPYTKEELELIAEEDGIKGIRAIAKMYDVKGVQISQLIAGILAAQPQGE